MSGGGGHLYPVSDSYIEVSIIDERRMLVGYNCLACQTLVATRIFGENWEMGQLAQLEIHCRSEGHMYQRTLTRLAQ